MTCRHAIKQRIIAYERGGTPWKEPLSHAQQRERLRQMPLPAECNFTAAELQAKRDFIARARAHRAALTADLSAARLRAGWPSQDQVKQRAHANGVYLPTLGINPAKCKTPTPRLTKPQLLAAIRHTENGPPTVANTRTLNYARRRLKDNNYD